MYLIFSMDTNSPWDSTPQAENQSTQNSQIFINTDATEQDISTANVFNYMTDGKEFSRAPKPKMSMLDIFEKWLKWGTLIVTLVTLVLFADTSFRLQENNSDSPWKYPFLCDRLTSGLNGYNNTVNGCKTLDMVKNETHEKKRVLEDRIVEQLGSYLPLKIQQSSLFAPEEAFIADTIHERVPLVDVMSNFGNAQVYANSGSDAFIECSGVQITSKWVFNTKCSVYGGPIGETGETGNLGSSRIETMRFIDYLWKPTDSHFIVTVPPSSLNINLLTDKEKERSEVSNFTTSTFVPIQLQYVAPFDKTPKI